MRLRSTEPTPLRAMAETLKRQYSPLGERSCTLSPTLSPSAVARREPTMTDIGLLRKSSKLPLINCCARSVVCTCAAGSIPNKSTVAFSKPERALKLPRKIGEAATTLENCRLTRMISAASSIPSPAPRWAALRSGATGKPSVVGRQTRTHDECASAAESGVNEAAREAFAFAPANK